MQRNKMYPIQNTEGLVSSPFKFLFHSWQKKKVTNEYSTNFFCTGSDEHFMLLCEGEMFRNLEREKPGICVNQPLTSSAPTTLT